MIKWSIPRLVVHANDLMAHPKSCSSLGFLILSLTNLHFFCPLEIVTCGADGQVRLVTLSSSGSASTKKMGQHRRCAHRLAIEPGSPHRFMSCGETSFIPRIVLPPSNGCMPYVFHRQCGRHYCPAVSIIPPSPQEA